MTASAPIAASLPPDRKRFVVPIVLLLACAFTCSTFVDGALQLTSAARVSREFQATLGGLGTNPTTRLSDGRHALDRRLGRSPFESEWAGRSAAAWSPLERKRVD